jgi:hypothetical protein
VIGGRWGGGWADARRERYRAAAFVRDASRRQSSGIICAPVGITMRELQEIFQERALKDLAPA